MPLEDASVPAVMQCKVRIGDADELISVEVFGASDLEEGPAAEVVALKSGMSRWPAEFGRKTHLLPSPFVGRPEAERVELTLQALLEFDSAGQDALVRGECFRKLIGGSLPEERDYLARAFDVAWRPRAADMARLYLLPQPELTQLREFQRTGVKWLTDHTTGILADDMGLGKTVQAISALRSLMWGGHARSALVVVPRSLISNWCRECYRWAPELVCRAFTRSGERGGLDETAMVRRCHVLLVNYEQLRSPPQSLLTQVFDVVVADEAHRLRNRDSLAYAGLQHLRWKRFWALTGTPIERDAEDLVTLLSLLAPARFSASDADHPAGVIRALARPYVLRRERQSVLPDLPPVIESKELLQLLPAQAREYRQAVAARSEDGIAHVLGLLSRLRQICDLAPRSHESAKIDRILEVLGEIRENTEKAVVFSYTLEPLRALAARVAQASGQESYGWFDGSLSLAERDQVLREFSRGNRVSFLLASMRAAGEGLTLTAANHVLFLNEWWNPSSFEQARDRVVRLGQTRTVRVYRYRCVDTIEDVLDRILAEKGEVIASLIGALSEDPRRVDVSQRALLTELHKRLVHELPLPYGGW